jgi:NADP-dependent 3-hydroxy acid dehydrogenase YdfG
MEKQVVVITGASAGVGRATARAFAARGARIGLIARNGEALEAAKSEVEARGGQAIVLPMPRPSNAPRKRSKTRSVPSMCG